MWHTSEGDRTLGGAEASLVAAAVTGMAERIREEASGLGFQWEYGVTLYDSLSWSQRLAILDDVATHLLTPTQETLELSAVAEATVGALFEHVRCELDLEIDDCPEPGTRWRQMVLDAYQATGLNEGDAGCETEEEESAEDYGWGTSSADCSDRSAWRDLVESLTDQILWDRDYEMMADLADQSPEKAALIKSYLGISDDYFSAAGPDAISEAEVARRFKRLNRVAGW